MELMNYFQPNEPQRVQAIPGVGLHVPIWILGSSLFGAQFAAAAGLPFAFASHFAPTQMMEAIDIYRTHFRPGHINQPYVMLGFNVFAADTDAQAQLLATSMQQAFVNLRSGRPSQLPPPQPGLASARVAPNVRPTSRRLIEAVTITTSTVEAGAADAGAEEGRTKPPPAPGSRLEPGPGAARRPSRAAPPAARPPRARRS